jgi:serine carboxypeptidase-like clade 2
MVEAGLRIFYYSGDLDAIVPITGTVFWFDQFRTHSGHAVKRSWRPWITRDKSFKNNQNISGMVWELDSLTLATVRGAGHMVPSDKPAEAE